MADLENEQNLPEVLKVSGVKTYAIIDMRAWSFLRIHGA